jgi:ribosomal protein S18 acetylase RimI-like enzyme
MQWQIRPFTMDDYQAIASIHNQLFPDDPYSPEEGRFWDKHRDPKTRFQRWLVERDGQTIGMAEYSQREDAYHPRKFWFNLEVHPDWQRQGIGSALLERLLAALQQYDPLLVQTQVREDMTPSVSFLEARGFQNVWRMWESQLDVTGFDFTPYADVEERLRERGIEIKPITELASDPERDRKLWALDDELEQDIPSLDEQTPFGYEQFVEKFLRNPQMPHEAYFIALHDGEYIGLTALWRPSLEEGLISSLTGVKRAYRRQGIALALKLRTIAYAQEQGKPYIKTWNDSPNEGMIALNERLGFVRHTGWITYRKMFSS